MLTVNDWTEINMALVGFYSSMHNYIEGRARGGSAEESRWLLSDMLQWAQEARQLLGAGDAVDTADFAALAARFGVAIEHWRDWSSAFVLIKRRSSPFVSAMPFGFRPRRLYQLLYHFDQEARLLDILEMQRTMLASTISSLIGGMQWRIMQILRKP